MQLQFAFYVNACLRAKKRKKDTVENIVRKRLKALEAKNVEGLRDQQKNKTPYMKTTKQFRRSLMPAAELEIS